MSDTRRVRVVIEGFYDLPADLRCDYEVDTVGEALAMDTATFTDDPRFCLDTLMDSGGVTVRLSAGSDGETDT